MEELIHHLSLDIEGFIPMEDQRFCILDTDVAEAEELMRQVGAKALSCAPDAFRGDVPAVFFRLRYTPPYEPFQEFAGSGASVPLLGFGNLLWQGVKEAVDKSGFIGIFMGGFKASAVGISAALVFGYIASFVFEPKMKK